MMKAQLQVATDMRTTQVEEAFSSLLDQTSNRLKMFTEGGGLTVVSGSVARLISPLLNRVLGDLPCCNITAMVFLPGVTKTALDHVVNLMTTGVSGFTDLTRHQIGEVREVANMLQIDLTNMEYVEKDNLVVKQARNEALSVGKEKNFSTEERPTEVNGLMLQIKTERPEHSEFLNDIEALLEEDAEKDDSVEERPVGFLNLSAPFTAPIQPSNVVEEAGAKHISSSSSIRPSSSSRCLPSSSSKRPSSSLTEETVSTLTSLVRDHKGSPSLQEMEELVSHAKRFRRDASPDRRNSQVHPQELVMPQQVQHVVQHRQYPLHYVPQPYPAHPHLAPHGSPGEALQPHLAPHGAPVGTVQAPHPVQHMPMVQYQHGGVVQYHPMPHSVLPQVLSTSHLPQTKLPSSRERRRRRSSSSTSSPKPSTWHEKARPVEARVKDHKRSPIGEKVHSKSDLATMTVQEKREMTCLDWNTGICPREETGRMCVLEGNNKKHVCSKIIRTNKFEANRVCWGGHREGEHEEKWKKDTKGFKGGPKGYKGGSKGPKGGFKGNKWGSKGPNKWDKKDIKERSRPTDQERKY